MLGSKAGAVWVELPSHAMTCWVHFGTMWFRHTHTHTHTHTQCNNARKEDCLNKHSCTCSVTDNSVRWL